MTVDLVLGLAKFEADSGKAAQILTRDSERMARAARTVELAIQKEADQVGRTNTEFLALQAAQAGLGESAQKLLSLTEQNSGAQQSAAAATAAGFSLATQAAEDYTSKRVALNKQLIQSILEVNAAADKQRAGLREQAAAGTISPDQLKAGLINTRAGQQDATQQLKAYRDQQLAILQTEAADQAAAEKRQSAAQKLIDSQNGLTASYRQQLAALRELRDAGSITPEQFRQAGTDLVSRQPAVQQRQAEAQAIAQTEAEDLAAVEARKAAAQSLIDKLNGLPATYRANLAALQASYAAEEISTQQFQDTLTRLNATRPDIQRYQQQQAAAQAAAAAEIKAIEDAEAADLAANAKRQASTQQLIDRLSGVGAQYRAQAEQLQKSLTAGDITPAQFQSSLGQLNAQRPDIQAAKQAQAAAEAAAAAQQKAIEATEAVDLAATAQRVAAAQKIIDVQNGVTASYSAQLEELRRLDAEGLISGDQFTRAFNDLSAKQPASQQYAAEIAAAKQVADAEQESVEKRIAAFQKLQDSVAKLNYKQQAEDQKTAAAAAKAEADAEEEAATRRVASAQKIIAVNAGLTASYADQIKALVDLKKQGNLSDDQFGQAKARLVAQQPINANPASGSNDAFIASLQRTAEIVGLTRAEVLAYDAAQKGLSASAAPFIAKIAEADANMQKFGRQTGLSIVQLQTLKYTLSDVVASLGSGISPFTILLQQGGQVAQIEGGVTGLLKGVVQAITPFRAALGLGGAALAAIGYAFIEGQKDAKAFQDAIVLSGNFSGQTAGKFAETAKAIAASGQISISSAREYGQALISTGQIAPQVFDQATKAAVLYGTATGKNSKDVAADFAAMGDSATKWVTDHNKQLNLFSAAEISHIKQLEDGGKAIEAQALIYDKLNERLAKLEPNLGTLDKAIRAVTNTWHGFWDAAFDVGRPETIEDRIVKARAALDKLKAGQGSTEGFGQAFGDVGGVAQATGGDRAADTAAAAEALRQNIAAQNAQRTAAANQAELEFLNKQATAADTTLQGQLKAAHAAEGLKKALADENALFAQQDALAKIDPAYAQQTAGLRSAQTRAALIKQINESYTDKKGTSEADAARKALLDQALKQLADNLTKQQDLLKFNQSVVDAIYAAGTTSLESYYDQRAKITAEGVKAELAKLSEAQARLQQELDAGKFKDPHERTQVQTQLNESVAKSAKVRLDAEHEITLEAYRQTAAVKALQDQSVSFYAQVLQLEGDDANAARLRTQQQIAQAQLLANKSVGGPSEIRQETISKYANLLDIQDQYAEVQKNVSIATAAASNAEETYTLRATQNGTGLFQQERDIYTIRAASLVQLGELADKAALLAAASTDPKIKQFAADLALQYQKAAEAVDPALQRLRSAGEQLGSGLASDFADALTSGAKLSDLMKSLEGTVVKIIADIGIKQPLETFLKGGIRDLTEGSNPVADFFRKNFSSKGVNASTGIGNDAAQKGFSPAKDSQQASEDATKSATEAQTTATTEATAATKAQTSALAENTAALKAFLDAKFGTGAGGSPTYPGDTDLVVDKSGLGTDAAAHGYSPAADGAAVTAAAKVASSQDAATTANYENSAAAVASAAGFKNVANELTFLSSATRLASLVMSTFSSTSSASSGSSGWGALLSLFGGSSGGSSGDALASSSTLSDTGATLFAKGGIFAPVKFADGGSFDDTIEPMRYARGGSFTNSIINSPTMFRFADGGVHKLGLMGEAGAEAIMPLKSSAGRQGIQSFDKNGRAAGLLSLVRGANGSLGVHAYAKGGIFTRETEATRPVRKYADGGVFERNVRPVYAYADGGSFTPGGGYEPAAVKFQTQGGSLLTGAGAGNQSSGSSQRAPIIVHVHTQAASTDRRTIDQIGKSAYEGAARAARRNG